MQFRKTFGLLLAVMMLVSVAAVVQAQSDGWEFSGYSQFRYFSEDSDVHGADAEDKFDVRRARIKAEGPVSDNTSFRIQLGLGGLDDDNGDDLDLKDLYLKRQFSPEWVGRLGYGNMEFGFDVPQSSSARLPFERSRIARMLLSGERTTGAFFFFEPADGRNAPVVTLGVSEDMDALHGDEAGGIKEAIAFSGRAEWPVDANGIVGASVLVSDADYWTAQGDVENNTDTLWGFHIRYDGFGDFGGLNFQGEYIDGERMDTDSNGWYGLLEFTPPESQGTVYYRYDEAETDGAVSDYERHTLGYAYDLDDAQRITAEMQDIENMDGNSGTDYGVQWQIKY